MQALLLIPLNQSFWGNGCLFPTFFLAWEAPRHDSGGEELLHQRKKAFIEYRLAYEMILIVGLWGEDIAQFTLHMSRPVGPLPLLLFRSISIRHDDLTYWLYMVTVQSCYIGPARGGLLVKASDLRFLWQ
jgi:hypothetical protein